MKLNGVELLTGYLCLEIGAFSQTRLQASSHPMSHDHVWHTVNYTWNQLRMKPAPSLDSAVCDSTSVSWCSTCSLTVLHVQSRLRSCQCWFRLQSSCRPVMHVSTVTLIILAMLLVSALHSALKQHLGCLATCSRHGCVCKFWVYESSCHPKQGVLCVMCIACSQYEKSLM